MAIQSKNALDFSVVFFFPVSENGDLLALETKYTLINIKNGKPISYATRAVKNEE